jgi:hypothetical protein
MSQEQHEQGAICHQVITSGFSRTFIRSTRLCETQAVGLRRARDIAQNVS